MSAPTDPLQTFAAALGICHETLDWSHLGTLYCEEGGEDFFSEQAVEAIQDAGLQIVSDLQEVLAPLPRAASLYVGVGVAELIPMLFEQILLGRPVRGATLPGAEADALTQALAAAHQELGVTMPQIDTRPLARIGMPAINHLWFASVITDPDHFPALHDELYGRKGTHLATGRGNLTKERRRALELYHSALRNLQSPAVITTSEEELPILLEAVGEYPGQLLIPPKGRLSAIVGDPLLHCNWRS
ncbi:MAG: hypothetical protein R3F33_00375 [Planctomycetota bacterium]